MPGTPGTLPPIAYPPGHRRCARYQKPGLRHAAPDHPIIRGADRGHIGCQRIKSRCRIRKLRSRLGRVLEIGVECLLGQRWIEAADLLGRHALQQLKTQDLLERIG
jgi:hypothetical protein